MTAINPVARRYARQGSPVALAVAVGLLASLGGCAETEPYTRASTWAFTGSNAANLAAMLDDPGDLARGRGDPGADGLDATMAVDRLRAGHVKQLTGSGMGTSGAGSSGSGASGSAN